jgi:hypothetical protein
LAGVAPAPQQNGKSIRSAFSVQIRSARDGLRIAEHSTFN